MLDHTPPAVDPPCDVFSHFTSPPPAGATCPPLIDTLVVVAFHGDGDSGCTHETGQNGVHVAQGWLGARHN
ncbi:MAG TPA: hypothetical protein VII50_03045 [Acidothermaceae bacterium]